MNTPVRLAAISLLALGALALSGCVMPVHHSRHRHHPRGHAWVHYPHEDVYFCTRHGDYWIYHAGDWRRRDHVDVELTSYVRLSTLSAHPFHSTHAWVYYADPGAYYCTAHHHAWLYHEGRWGYRVRWSPGVHVGVNLQLGVGRPYLHHKRLRGPASVRAGHKRASPRARPRSGGPGRLPSRPSSARPPDRTSPRRAARPAGAPQPEATRGQGPKSRGPKKQGQGRGPKRQGQGRGPK